MLGSSEDFTEYTDHLGAYFIFVGIAFLSIFFFISNYFCLKFKYCCFEQVHNKVCKRIFWWTSLIFFCGIFACCKAGFFSAYRLGLTAYGFECSEGMIYRDVLFGQQKSVRNRYKGIDETIKILNEVKEKFNNTNLGDINGAINLLKDTKIEGLGKYKENILSKFKNFNDYLIIFGKIIPFILFLIMIIVSIVAIVSLVMYTCVKKKQTIIKKIFNVVWIVTRVLMIIFFLYGTAFGCLRSGANDIIGVFKVAFKYDPNIDSRHDYSFDFAGDNGGLLFKFCLNDKINLEDPSNHVPSFLNYDPEKIPTQTNSIQKYFTNKEELDFTMLYYLNSLDCTFLQNDFEILIKALSDMSGEATILCALSCLIGFFGSIAVHFLHLANFHYDRQNFPQDYENDNKRNNHQLNNSKHSSKNRIKDRSNIKSEDVPDEEDEEENLNKNDQEKNLLDG